MSGTGRTAAIHPSPQWVLWASTHLPALTPSLIGASGRARASTSQALSSRNLLSDYISSTSSAEVVFTLVWDQGGDNPKKRGLSPDLNQMPEIWQKPWAAKNLASFTEFRTEGGLRTLFKFLRVFAIFISFDAKGKKGRWPACSWAHLSPPVRDGMTAPANHAQLLHRGAADPDSGPHAYKKHLLSWLWLQQSF